MQFLKRLQDTCTHKRRCIETWRHQISCWILKALSSYVTLVGVIRLFNRSDGSSSFFFFFLQRSYNNYRRRQEAWNTGGFPLLDGPRDHLWWGLWPTGMCLFPIPSSFKENFFFFFRVTRRMFGRLVSRPLRWQSLSIRFSILILWLYVPATRVSIFHSRVFFFLSRQCFKSSLIQFQNSQTSTSTQRRSSTLLIYV